jgi:hypothetical protein
MPECGLTMTKKSEVYHLLTVSGSSMCVRVCVCVCARVCMRVFVRVGIKLHSSRLTLV